MLIAYLLSPHHLHTEIRCKGRSYVFRVRHLQVFHNQSWAMASRFKVQVLKSHSHIDMRYSKDIQPAGRLCQACWNSFTAEVIRGIWHLFQRLTQIVVKGACGGSFENKLNQNKPNMRHDILDQGRFRDFTSGYACCRNSKVVVRGSGNCRLSTLLALLYIKSKISMDFGAVTRQPNKLSGVPRNDWDDVCHWHWRPESTAHGYLLVLCLNSTLASRAVVSNRSAIVIISLLS